MYEPGHAFYEKIQKSKNSLLVRDELGKAKLCVRDLPPPDFTYGKKAPPDPENAGAVINKWVEHTESKPLVPDRDFRKMNKLAVSNKCTSPKEINQFRKTNDVRITESRSRNSRSPSLPDGDFKFGVPTKPGTPLQKVMSFEYGRNAAEQIHQQFATEAAPSAKPMRTVPRSNPSISKEAGQTTQELFKLSKFKKVGAKTDSHSKRVPSIKRAEGVTQETQENEESK